MEERTWTRGSWIGAALLSAVALFLPVQGIVDALAGRINTVHNFPGDFIQGFQTLRLACAFNAVVLILLPRLRSAVRFADPKPWGWSSQDRLPALALYAVAMLLALPGLWESFQSDEWHSLQEYIRHGPLVIVCRSRGDNHQLYSLLAWPFVAVLGPGEAALRLPSLLLGPLGPVLLYALLRREHPRGRAFLAALPLAASSFLASYSHEGRAYAALFPALLGLCLLQRDALEGSRRAWIGYIAVGVGAVYLHLFASMAVAALAGAAFLRPEGRTPSGRARNLAALLLIAGISLLLYAPVLPKYFEYSGQMQTRLPYRGDAAPMLGEGFILPLSPFFAIPFALTFLAGSVSSRRLTSEAFACLLCWGLQAALTVLSKSDWAARLHAPSFILAWPVIAGFLARTPRGPWMAAGLLALSLTADVGYLRLGRRHYREAAQEIVARRRPGESFAILAESRPMNAYLPEPAEVLEPRALVARAPDWCAMVDVNRVFAPEVAAMLDRDYEPVFRLPSAYGNMLGYRKK